MRKNNIRLMAMAIAAIFVFVFQNCSNPSGGFSLNDNSGASTPGATPSPSPSTPSNIDEQQLQSMQQTYLSAKQNPGSTIDELNATIQIITQILNQVTNYPTDNFSQALLLFRTQLIDDLNTEIQLLQDEVTQLQNQASSPSPSPTPTSSPAPTPSPTATPSPSPTTSPTPTPTPSPTATPSPSPTPSPVASISCSMDQYETVSKKGKDVKNYASPVNVANPTACLAVCENYNHAGICSFVYHSANNPQNGGQCILNIPQDTDGAKLYSGDSTNYAGYCQ